MDLDVVALAAQRSWGTRVADATSVADVIQTPVPMTSKMYTLHRTSVLNVNIFARAHCQYSTTANVCFHMATDVGTMQLYLALKTFRL